MAKKQTVNGGAALNPVLTPTNADIIADMARQNTHAPVVPAKSEAQLMMEAEIERLKRENESLKNRPANALSLRVSEKGALSVYGLGRFPVTLYQEQWTRLVNMAPEIKAFIAANAHRLKVKGE